MSQNEFFSLVTILKFFSCCFDERFRCVLLKSHLENINYIVTDYKKCDTDYAANWR